MRDILLDDFNIYILPGYIGAAFFISIVFRMFMSLLQSLELKYSGPKDLIEQKNLIFIDVYISFLYGQNPNNNRNDLFYNFLLGFFELLIYPILIKSSNIEIIGAWLGFKALAQWGRWNKERLIYNRFLIANLLIVVISYFLSHIYIILGMQNAR